MHKTVLHQYCRIAVERNVGISSLWKVEMTNIQKILINMSNFHFLDQPQHKIPNTAFVKSFPLLK